MATRKRAATTSSKPKPGRSAKAKPAAAPTGESGGLPPADDVREAVGWLLAMASAYGPELGLSAGGTEPTKTKKLVQAAVDTSQKLREHLQQLHRNTFQASVIIDWLKENSRRSDAAEQLRRMLQSFTGQTFKPAQTKALLESAKGKGKAAGPQDKAMRAVAKLLGLADRDAEKGKGKGSAAQPRAWSLGAMPAWLGYAEPLRDENARRAALRLVIVDLLRYSGADYEKVLDVLGLTPDEDDAGAPLEVGA